MKGDIQILTDTLTQKELSNEFLKEFLNERSTLFYQYNVINLRFREWQLAKHKSNGKLHDLKVNVIAKSDDSDLTVRKNIRMSIAGYIALKHPDLVELKDPAISYLNSMSMMSIVCKKEYHAELTSMIEQVDLADLQEEILDSLSISEFDKSFVDDYIIRKTETDKEHFIGRQVNEVALDFEDDYKSRHIALDNSKTALQYLSAQICRKYKLKKSLSIMSTTKIARPDMLEKYKNVSRTYAYKPLVYQQDKTSIEEVSS